MDLRWLIQTGVFGQEEEDAFLCALKDLGHKYSTFGSYFEGMTLRDEAFNGYNIIRCSLEMVSAFADKPRCILWCYFPNFKYHVYCLYYFRHLLNKDVSIMNASDIISNRCEIEKEFVKNDKLFIKQDCGSKSFLSGECINFSDIDILLKECCSGKKRDTLFVVSSPKQIDQEWRLVVVDKKIVAGCQYLPVENSECPSEIFDFGREIIKNQWEPEIIYTLDICLSGDRLYLLEINSFSCAGLYENNMKMIIEVIHNCLNKHNFFIDS